MIAAISIQSQSAQAQSFQPAVGVCTGASLPPSLLHDALDPLVTGLASPIENTLNSLISATAILPGISLVAPLDVDVTGILDDVAAGDTITLQVLDVDGNLVGPSDECNAVADTITLTDQGGISIGGNRITGLGANGETASAADIDAIAFGNGAVADTGATGSIALGANASVTAANSVALGQDSQADRGAQAGYTAAGLSGSQTSAGEVSVGGSGSERQITNLAPGSAATDAVNVAQLDGVITDVGALDVRLGTAEGDLVLLDDRVTVNEGQIATNATDIGTNAADITALADVAVQYDSAAGKTVTLAGAGGTVIANVADGEVSATSNQAVNGSQLFATDQNVAQNATDIGTNATAITSLDTRVSTAEGDIAANVTAIGDLDGRVTTNESDIASNATDIGALDGRVATNEGDIVDLAGRVTTNETDIAANAGDIATVTNRVGVVESDLSALSDVAIRYDGVAARTATLVGAGGTVITNLADGSVSETSTDAVNGSQLFAVNQRIDDSDLDLTNLEARVTTNEGDIATLDGRITTAEGDIVDIDTRVGDNETDIADLDIRVGTNTDDIASLNETAVRYDDATQSRITLGGADGTVIANVAAGELSETSNEAVNGAQLFATNQQVATNSTRISVVEGDIGDRITTVEGGVVAIDNRVTTNTQSIAELQSRQSPVRYLDADGNATTTPTDSAALAGSSGGAVTLTNVAEGELSATSTDAVNGTQLNATNQQVATNAQNIQNNADEITNIRNTFTGSAVSPVQYSNADTPTDPNGGTITNDVTLVGQDASAPVAVHNVAAGQVSAGSTDAVNGGQLHATDQRAQTALATAQDAQTVAANSVQYDQGGSAVTLRPGGDAVALRNVAAGTSATDAVNLQQLQSGMAGSVAMANAYTDEMFSRVGGAINNVDNDAEGGIAGAMALAALPQANRPGASMFSIGVGQFGSEAGFAMGLSTTFDDGNGVFRLGGTVDSRGHGGANAGVGFQF
ncbi:MAG: YadA-like family protein [Parasphingopyxis sp.]|uniref:YadA family autotransporter adhesin n=1 Tax=Parasphingopyxis sp. TaxID=1920299 RepID=UPI0032ED0B31